MTKSKKPFWLDALKMKEEIQAKLYEQTKNMTDKELIEFLRKASEDARQQKKLATQSAS